MSLCTPFFGRLKQWIKKIPRFFFMYNNVEELKSAKKKLEKSYEQLRDFTLALESISSSIVITNSFGNIEYVNAAFEKNMGYKKEEVIGKNSTQLQSANPKSAVYKEIAETIRNGKTWEGELHNQRKDGSLIWEKATISPVYTFDGKFHKFITVKVDITEEIQLRTNVEKSLQILKNVNKKKDEFISIASHELKTPLSIIKGYSSLLLERKGENLTEEQRSFLQQIFSNSSHLITLVKDMLDLSKLEFGQMSFHATNIQLTEVLQDVITQFTFVAQEKGIRLNIDIKPECSVFADPQKLSQVMSNLMSNAIKFTSQSGSVSLKAQIWKKNNKYILFSVSDTGIGIPQNKLSEIFEKFVQVDNHLQREAGGTGLGLSIVKGFIRAMGGDIWVESTLGEGSEFFFTLPRSS